MFSINDPQFKCQQDDTKERLDCALEEEASSRRNREIIQGIPFLNDVLDGIEAIYMFDYPNYNPNENRLARTLLNEHISSMRTNFASGNHFSSDQAYRHMLFRFNEAIENQYIDPKDKIEVAGIYTALLLRHTKDQEDRIASLESPLSSILPAGDMTLTTLGTAKKEYGALKKTAEKIVRDITDSSGKIQHALIESNILQIITSAKDVRQSLLDIDTAYKAGALSDATLETVSNVLISRITSLATDGFDRNKVLIKLSEEYLTLRSDDSPGASKQALEKFVAFEEKLDELKTKEADFLTGIDNVKDAFEWIGTLAGAAGNNRVAEEITAFAVASHTIIKSIGVIAGTVASSGPFAPFTAALTVASTLGKLFSGGGLFGGGGSSSAKHLQKALSQVSKQVTDLAKDIEERFDAVFKMFKHMTELQHETSKLQISVIQETAKRQEALIRGLFETMQYNFKDLLEKLGQFHADVFRQFVETRGQLNRIEKIASDTKKEVDRLAVVAQLGFQDLYLQDYLKLRFDTTEIRSLQPYPQYVISLAKQLEYTQAYLYWMLTGALHRLVAGGMLPGDTPASITQHVRLADITEHVNTLVEPVDQGQITAPGKPTPTIGHPRQVNPHVFTERVLSFLKFIFLFPELKIDPSFKAQFESIRALGVNFIEFIQDLRGNVDLYDVLLTRYENSLRQLSDSIKQKMLDETPGLRGRMASEFADIAKARMDALRLNENGVFKQLQEVISNNQNVLDNVVKQNVSDPQTLKNATLAYRLTHEAYDSYAYDLSANADSLTQIKRQDAITSVAEALHMVRFSADIFWSGPDSRPDLKRPQPWRSLWFRWAWGLKGCMDFFHKEHAVPDQEATMHVLKAENQEIGRSTSKVYRLINELQSTRYVCTGCYHTFGAACHGGAYLPAGTEPSTNKITAQSLTALRLGIDLLINGYGYWLYQTPTVSRVMELTWQLLVDDITRLETVFSDHIDTVRENRTALNTEWAHFSTELQTSARFHTFTDTPANHNWASLKNATWHESVRDSLLTDIQHVRPIATILENLTQSRQLLVLYLALAKGEDFYRDKTLQDALSQLPSGQDIVAKIQSSNGTEPILTWLDKEPWAAFNATRDHVLTQAMQAHRLGRNQTATGYPNLEYALRMTEIMINTVIPIANDAVPLDSFYKVESTSSALPAATSKVPTTSALPVATSKVPTTSALPAATSSAPKPPPNNGQFNQENTSQGESGTGIAGIVLGCVSLLLIVAGISSYFWHRRKKGIASRNISPRTFSAATEAAAEAVAAGVYLDEAWETRAETIDRKENITERRYNHIEAESERVESNTTSQPATTPLDAQGFYTQLDGRLMLAAVCYEGFCAIQHWWNKPVDSVEIISDQALVKKLDELNHLLDMVHLNKLPKEERDAFSFNQQHYRDLIDDYRAKSHVTDTELTTLRKNIKYFYQEYRKVINTEGFHYTEGQKTTFFNASGSTQTREQTVYEAAGAHYQAVQGQLYSPALIQ
ncbi:MAG: hypothetical protein DHS20C10_06100 [marine bacterium B5-7]|nr:MAG: hypothetical protein DHS20C10_06100 [marine bacterium B5-7]